MADDVNNLGDAVVSTGSTPTSGQVVVTSSAVVQPQGSQFSPAVLQAAFQSALGNLLQQSSGGGGIELSPIAVTVVSLVSQVQFTTPSSSGTGTVASSSGESVELVYTCFDTWGLRATVIWGTRTAGHCTSSSPVSPVLSGVGMSGGLPAVVAALPVYCVDWQCLFPALAHCCCFVFLCMCAGRLLGSC